MSKVLYALRILCRTSTINPLNLWYCLFCMSTLKKRKEKREKRFFELKIAIRIKNPWNSFVISAMAV